MGTINFILLSLLIIGIYVFCNLILNRDRVLSVEAGDTGNVNPVELRKKSFYAPHRVFKDADGNVINTFDMIIVKVCGDCMCPRNIPNGSELLVKKIHSANSAHDIIKKDNILLIHLKDKDLYKIRIFDDFNGNNELKTYRFNKNGEKVDSSRPHRIEDVIGIVKYKV